MILPALPDVAFSVFNFSVYWYGIIMATAIFVAIICADKLLDYIHHTKGVLIEFAPIIIICGILCARLYFCLLNFHHYLLNPLEILDIREGGLSIHGGILGGILSMIFMVKKCQIPFLKIADCMACGTIIGQAIGRWGNYFNSEAYGLPTTSQKWGVFIPLQNRVSGFENYELFHPTFLYESVCDLIIWAILCFLIFKFGRKFQGLTFFSYLILYALVRFFIEQIRLDSALNINSIPVAMIASVLIFIIGVIGLSRVLYFRNR